MIAKKYFDTTYNSNLSSMINSIFIATNIEAKAWYSVGTFSSLGVLT